MANDRTFLGRGWAFPPAFGAGGGEIETVDGEEDVRQSLEILLATRPGERVLQERFGCGLEDVMFEEIDQHLVTTVTSRVKDAILYHEPRIQLDGVDVAASGEAGRIEISIRYTVRATNTRFNMVYPFYLNEAVVPV